MQENAVKAKWGRGEVTFGGWLSIPSSFSAEVMAYRGFDWLCLDLQHGVIDYQVAVTMLQAISATDTVPIVRVPDASFGFINKMLDAGAMGIIVPLINTAEEARAVVAACRYFPDGSRSIGPTRVSVSAGPEYAQRANAEVACIPMIETKQALGNLDAILSVPGVDAVYVGPSDLSLTLGLPPGPDSGGAFEEARLAIAQACSAKGVVAGIHANAALAAKHAAAGYQMITVSTDVGSLVRGAEADLVLARAETTGVAAASRG